MGCGGSKLDSQEPVALCRSRSDLLADAIRHRYALAAAHAAYSDSLLSLASSLHRVLSPALPLSSHRKVDPPPSPPSPPPPISHSHSSSHIQFSDDSDDDTGAASSHHLLPPEALPPPSFLGLYYARSQPPRSSVSVEHRPASSETVRFGYSAAAPYYGSQSPSPTPHNPQSYPYFPDNYGGTGGGGGGGGGFIGSSSPPPAASTGSSSSPSSSKAPPPPPSPPRTSTWDFLNPFDSFDSYYASYPPSQSSKEVRDEEGIPDLEEDEPNVVKEAYGDQIFVPSPSAAITLGDYSSKAASSANVHGRSNVAVYSHGHGAADGKPGRELQVVDKKVMSREVRGAQEEQRDVAAPRRFQDVSEIVGEIKAQFDRASKSARELSGVLEVGKQPYYPNNFVYEGEGT